VQRDSPRAKNLDVPRYNANGEPIELIDYMDPEYIQLNDKFVIRVRDSGFEILCFGDAPQFTKRSEAFFDLGSLEVVAEAAV
jgi:hypothetical protein